ncbi:UV DNA damage repair endonuclease UvsE [Alkalithermobacter paradoxus]|uniref:UV DNA damage endonuclease n=1 Tax=Alkalithermobacter paradoxus TaxID=29349 RepID=A0A1V4IBW3_9FIRM|nr:UV DNA damage endonuclease [[Clostridium] thermoalcaliphilum]
MRIRFGYVAIALNLPKVTSSSTLTYARYKKMTSSEERISALKKVTLSNLDDLYKILEYNIQNDIHFYRITSKLVPLDTHPDVTDWDYRRYFKKDFERIGKLIKKHGMRVDTHPDQFNVINSTKEDVVENTKNTLLSHVNLFEDMNYKHGKMVIHVGSAQGGKEEAIKRFITNFSKFPIEIRKKLILENDDKSFTTKEVLNICKELDIPMVLDVHHHICNSGGDNLDSMINDIFNTWNKEDLPPKIHFSSPKEGQKDRKHSDYINPYDFIEFVEKCKRVNMDFDVMIEAKQKDLSLFKLIDDLKDIKKNWKWIDKTTLEI